MIDGGIHSVRVTQINVKFLYLAKVSTQQEALLEENAELSIISDYDHAVWTILLGEGYLYELLKERLQVFLAYLIEPHDLSNCKENIEFFRLYKYLSRKYNVI